MAQQIVPNIDLYKGVHIDLASIQEDHLAGKLSREELDEYFKSKRLEKKFFRFNKESF